MTKLTDLLAGGEPEDRIQTYGHPLLQFVPVTDYALRKARTYAKIATEQTGLPKMECGGYLIAPKDSQERVATDAFFARGQRAGPGQYLVLPEDINRAGAEIDEMGYRPLGWWHSHGFEKCFFSPIDDQGQMTVLNQIAHLNYVEEKRIVGLEDMQFEIHDDETHMYLKGRPQKRFVFGNTIPAEMKVEETIKIGFAYGLVVNTRPGRDVYAEIAIRDLCNGCVQIKDSSDPFPVQVVPSGKRLPPRRVLEREVREKLSRKIWFGWGGHPDVRETQPAHVYRPRRRPSLSLVDPNVVPRAQPKVETESIGTRFMRWLGFPDWSALGELDEDPEVEGTARSKKDKSEDIAKILDRPEMTEDK